MEWADVYIGLRGASNLHEHDDISADRLSLNQRAMGKVSTLRWQKTRWCLVRVPNAAFAQQAETDEETITEMFFDACLLDWHAEAGSGAAGRGGSTAGSRVRVTGRDTDLRFSVQGPQVAGGGRADQHAGRGDHDRPGGGQRGRGDLLRVPRRARAAG